MKALRRRDRLNALGSALGHSSGAPPRLRWAQPGQSQRRPKTPARRPPLGCDFGAG